MEKFTAAKFAFRAASIAVEILILLVVASPILGAVTPQVNPQNELGLGVNLQTVQPQLQSFFDNQVNKCVDETAATNGSAPTCSYTLAVPAFNNWFLTGAVGLSLSLAVNGTTLYQTPKENLTLPPFHSGVIDVGIDVPNSVLTRMQGQEISGGGQMTLSETGFWSITVDLSQG